MIRALRKYLAQRTLDLTPDMELTAVLEREIERALQQRKQIRMMGFARPYVPQRRARG